MRKNIGIMILMILLINSSVRFYAQVNFSIIDSLQKSLDQSQDVLQQVVLYQQLADHYIYQPQYHEYLFKAMQLAKSHGMKTHQAQCLQKLGKYYSNQQDYVQALSFLQSSAAIYKNFADKNDYWSNVKDIGYVYYSMGDYSQAINHYLDALHFFEKSKNFEKVAYMYNNIGILFHRQKEINRALYYYQKAIDILNQNPQIQSNIHSMLHTNIGLSLFEQGEYEKAAFHYHQSNMHNESIDDLRVYTVNIGNLALVYSKLKAYDKAENLFRLAIQKSRKMDNQLSVASNMGDLGIMFLTKADETSNQTQRNIYLNKSIELFEKALIIFEKNNDLRRYQGYSLELSHAYELLGDFQKSLISFQKHVQYRDSVFNADNIQELARQEIQYEFEKKENAIKLETEKQIAVRDATLEANKRQRWLLIIGILLLTIVGILLYSQNRIRKSTNTKLKLLNQELNQANQIKIRFFSILNHDLRSPISNIIKIIRLQQNPNVNLDDSTHKRLQKKTVESAENLLETMDDLLLWSKEQMENFRPQFVTVSINQIFTDVHLFFQNTSNVTFVFDNPQNTQLTTDPNYLKTIMRNLTHNAIKALEEVDNPKIVWQATQQDNQVMLSISDNGRGSAQSHFKPLFDEQTQTNILSGLGLHIVRDMAKAIGATLEVNSVINKGTRINIIFMLT